MKKIIRIYIAIIASVCLFMSLPADIYAVVIDVSSYNGFIQWDNMKNYIEGTIIRIGYGNDIQSQDDAAAIRNMDECERLGIPYGVYLYSYALDYYDAASETAHALRLLKGRSPELGVWFDMEDADGYIISICINKILYNRLGILSCSWKYKMSHNYAFFHNPGFNSSTLQIGRAHV